MMRCCLKGKMWLLTALLAGSALLMAGRGFTADSPTGRIVAQVEVTGNHIRKTENILAIMRTRPGTAYDPAIAQEDARALQNTKWFAPGRVEINTTITSDGRVIVFVQVVELMGIVEEIVFVGAQHLSKNDLNSAVGIRKGEPMNVLANKLGRDNLLRKYQEEGRSLASVELVEGNKPSDTRVVYNIVEGPVVKVKEVEFQGAVKASVGRLREQVVTKADFGILPKKFDPTMLDVDRQKLIEYYHGLGFLGVVVTPEVVQTSDIGRVIIVYHIVEGMQYIVAGKQIDGNRSFDTPTLEGLTELKPGEPYDRRKAEADVKRMKTYMGERGINAPVEQKLYEVPGQPGLVQVHYEVMYDAATPKKVGRVIIAGNEITKDRVIQNQLGLYPGQVFEYPQLQEAKSRLQRLGLFDNETSPPVVEAIRSDIDSPFEDVLVRINETRTGSFMVGGSVNSDMGLMGNISINERNFDITRLPTSWDDIVEGRAFRGDGEELRLEAMPGIDFSSYRASWRNPTLFDTPFGLTVAGYFREMEVAEYLQETLGMRVTLDRQLDPYWRASIATRVEGEDIKDVPYWAPPQIEGDAGHQFLVGVRAGLTRDSRNSYMNPTEGSVFDIGVEQCFGTQEFPIGTASFTQFLSNKAFARQDGSGQQVLILKSMVEVEGGNAPVYERFYGGGIGNFRGFDFRGMGPFINDLAVGGTFGWINTIEYQIPLLPNDALKGVLFCDHGTIESSPSIRNYRVAIGAGVRVSVPALGPLPLALDFGIPLNQAPNDKKQLICFSMGVFGGPGGY